MAETTEATRTVLVTGGGRGLGREITTAFHAADAHVVIASRTDSELTSELAPRALFVKCDVRKPNDLHRAVRAAVDWTGRLDVMVNNAGYSAWRPIAEVDDEFLSEMVDVNLKGVLFGCQAAAERIMKGGCIINIASLAGKRGSANNSVYCATKFGVVGVTQALAKELGPRGIRVNAVCPVYVRTEGLKEALTDARSPTGGADLEEYFARFATTQSALGRLPTGEEVAATCVFLASPAAAAITGQSLNVDCGVLPQ